MKIAIDVFCRHCDKRCSVKVDSEGYTEWRSGGGLIQHLLPENTQGERELLISQCCPDCFDSMFSNVWYEEDEV